MPRDLQLQRFVRSLLGGGTATRDGSLYRSGGGQSADAAVVEGLISAGGLAGDGTSCRANAETRTWLKRAQLDADAFAGQHRQEQVMPDGATVNLAESPLSRLAAASGGQPPFLDRHQVEAGERGRRLVERAQLQPRLTMAYSASRTAGNRQQAASDISDLAADARRDLARIHAVLPRDCAGVVLDVCGLLKGLQEVERDRGWPRRSAKLVLRIGLEQLAQHYGLGSVARGAEAGRKRSWMGEGARPMQFG